MKIKKLSVLLAVVLALALMGGVAIAVETIVYEDPKATQTVWIMCDTNNDTVLEACPVVVTWDEHITVYEYGGGLVSLTATWSLSYLAGYPLAGLNYGWDAANVSFGWKGANKAGQGRPKLTPGTVTGDADPTGIAYTPVQGVMAENGSVGFSYDFVTLHGQENIGTAHFWMKLDIKVTPLSGGTTAITEQKKFGVNLHVTDETTPP